MVKKIESFDVNFMEHITQEQNSLYISLWRSGSKKRKDIIENLDFFTRFIFDSREKAVNGDIKISEEELLIFQLYIIFKRYVFSTIAAFFRGYYDISLANARVAFEASIYAYIFHHNHKLKAEYKNKKFLRKLDKKFLEIYKFQKDLGDIDKFLEVYNLCSERGAHCDYRIIEDTLIKSGNDILLPLNDLLDDESGEFDEKLFEILREFSVSLKIFNLVINQGHKAFLKKFNDLISEKLDILLRVDQL